MGGICRIYRRTRHGVKLIAEIRNGKVKGREAGEIRKRLKEYGFPYAPIDALVDQLLMADDKLGAAIIPDRED
jgi:hypothetical protein